MYNPLTYHNNNSLILWYNMKVFCCKRKPRCVNSWSVMMVILWDGLMFLHVNLLAEFGSKSSKDNRLEHGQSNIYTILFAILYCLIYFFYPFFGILADVKTGRYNIIITGVCFSFTSWIIVGLAAIVKLYFVDFNVLLLTLSGFSYVLQVIGYCCFRSNVIQFNIDQLVGASADELSATINWHSINIPLVSVISNIGECLIGKHFVIVSYIVSGVAVSTVIVTNSLFKHKLDTTPHIINPLKLITKVLNYARKNKYPRNRSAFTYWEEDYPSRLDLGKEKYGGPFSEEMVEDVKTFLRLVPLLVCIIGLPVCSSLSNTYSSHHRDLNFISCFLTNNSIHSLVSTILILFYQWVIYPCLFKYIPSMLKRIGLGLVFAVFTPLYYVILYTWHDHFNMTSYQAIIIPQILYGISFIFIYPISLEFTIAQSPHQMRGLMVGLWYAAFGIGYVINISVKFPFNCQKDINCQSLYYYVVMTIAVLIILIVFIILAKWYKLRVRGNEVNIHLIAEEHYERYMDQEYEVEYRR